MIACPTRAVVRQGLRPSVGLPSSSLVVARSMGSFEPEFRHAFRRDYSRRGGWVKFVEAGS